MTAVFVYMTCEDEMQAEEIGAALVQERLAACVNILPGMRSLYWWEGKVEKGSEVVLIAKSMDNMVEALTQKVKEMHPYEVPCVVTLPITGGNSDFLDWIREETGSK